MRAQNKAQEALRAKLAADTEAFLQRGGAIRKIPTGVGEASLNGVPQVHMEMMVKARQKLLVVNRKRNRGPDINIHSHSSAGSV